MSLTNRLSVFFLAALAVVLVGFSLALYLLASEQLHSRDGHRLDAAMQTLVAAIEVHPGDVEWEPLERRIALGADPGPDQIRWAVHAADGRLVDCSGNIGHPTAELARLTAPGWRVVARRVRAGSFRSEPVDGRAETAPGAFTDGFPVGQTPGTVPLPADRTFHGDELVLTVGVADAPAAAALWQLAVSMAVISGAVWLSAAVCGRWLCRRALAPVIHMAASARALRQRATDTSFLDVAPTGDELEDLGTAFNDLLADLRESLDRQQRFTGDASHQLRTPLAALLTSVEVALRTERSAAEYQRVLDVVRRRGGQLRQVLESLLFLARPEAAARPPDPVPVDLVDWCRERLAGWGEHERAADLRLDAPDAPVVVRTQTALLGQVLDNLIDNALKYSDPGSRVTVVIEARPDGVGLAVTDDGCGIAADELPRVCEPFYRATAARWMGKPGAGLGLTVARRLAGTLGGRWEVASESGKGSRFGLVLRPHAVRPDAPIQAAAAGQPAAPGAARS